MSEQGKPVIPPMSRRAFLARSISVTAAPSLDANTIATVASATISQNAQDFFGLTKLIDPWRTLNRLNDSSGIGRFAVWRAQDQTAYDHAFMAYMREKRAVFTTRNRHLGLVREALHKVMDNDIFLKRASPEDLKIIDATVAEGFDFDGPFPMLPTTTEQQRRLGAFALEWFKRGDRSEDNNLVISYDTLKEYLDNNSLYYDIERLMEHLLPQKEQDFSHLAREFLKEELSGHMKGENPFLSRETYKKLGFDKEFGRYDDAKETLQKEITQDIRDDQDWAKRELQQLLDTQTVSIEHLPREGAATGMTSFGRTESYHILPARLYPDGSGVGIDNAMQTLITYVLALGPQQRKNQFGIVQNGSEIDIIDPPKGLKILLDEAIKKQRGAQATRAPGS